jgi:hypothetical protein
MSQHSANRVLFCVVHLEFLLGLYYCLCWISRQHFFFFAGGHARQKIHWTHRIAAAIGVAKGIQFLHTGIVPGVYSNNLKITDVLLDQNLVAKISSYNLPLLAENRGMVFSFPLPEGCILFSIEQYLGAGT